jgi:hypothetical protein
MITNRIATALRRQEWTTVFIEFFLVIFGVLIALELDQWKDGLAESAHEERLLLAVLDDVRQDVLDLENVKLSLTAVASFGATAISYLENDNCADDCWATLVAFFHASQWIDLQLNRATYDEMRRAGLPSNPDLKSELARYHAINEQGTRVFSDLPRYRELVRSIIPAAIQTHLWSECFRTDGRHQYLMDDCAAPRENGEIRQILAEIRANPEVKASLNFWISTVTVVMSTLDRQLSEAQSVISSLSHQLDDK